jgi:uroporphyrinogen-III decarboxylase
MVFWGGGVNTQKTLPFGTPEEVHKEVLERLKIFSKGGGYIFNTIHNIQANTPIANIAAMVDAVKEFNGVR